jgi:hypothetical protein
MNLKLCAVIVAPALAITAAIWFGNIPEAPYAPINARHSLEARMDVPRNIEAILVRSCKDCHSNETRWPWYSHLPVVSGLLKEDVRRARSQVNFSEWSATAALGRDEERAALNGICEELRSGDMPLARYQRMHRKSRLTPADVESVCAWTDRAGAMLPPSSGVSKFESRRSVLERGGDHLSQVAMYQYSSDYERLFEAVPF